MIIAGPQDGEAPKMTIDTHHLITLPKDGGEFKHHAFADLSREWETFKLYRELWRLEKEWDAKPAKASKATKSAEPKPVISEKPRVRVKAQSTPALTMAEMLRSYGHVPSFDENSGARA
jgi:hypothetical protein